MALVVFPSAELHLHLSSCRAGERHPTCRGQKTLSNKWLFSLMEVAAVNLEVGASVTSMLPLPSKVRNETERTPSSRLSAHMEPVECQKWAIW